MIFRNVLRVSGSMTPLLTNIRRYVVCEGTTKQLARLLQHISCTAGDSFNDCVSRNMTQRLLLKCKKSKSFIICTFPHVLLE